MAKRIKKDDLVFILVGDDKGRQGKVIRVVDKGKRLLVEGVNLVKKSVKPNPQANQPGGIVEKEAPVHISNVALVVSGGKGTKNKSFSKVGYKLLPDGRKVRYFKSNNEIVDVN